MPPETKSEPQKTDPRVKSDNPVAEAPAVKTPKVRRYRLLAGLFEDGPPGGPNRLYRKNEIIETTQDLIRKYGPEKFLRVDDDSPMVDSLNLQELLNLAAELELTIVDPENITKNQLKEAILARRPEWG